MNLYGFATGTNDYSLNLSERDSLRVGDIVTVAFLNGNTGASTLSVNGNAPLPLLRNESAMSSGDLVALTLYQFCFTGAAFKQDVQASAGATTDASLLTSGTLAEARLPNNINATRVADGSISNTEFQYLNNVSSNIQSQLDTLTTAISGEASTRAAADSGLTSSIAGKADTSHTHSGTDIVTGTVPVAAIPTAIPAASIANGTVDNTEFQTLNGVTSNIQNQLDNKAALSHSHAASDITSGTIATARLGSGTADSTTFLCGDQTYKTVSATDSTKVPLSTGTTKGDIITYTASGTVTRRAVGSSGQFLTPNSGNSDGLEYRALTQSDMPQLYRLEADGLDPQNTASGTTVTKTYNTPAVNTGPAWSYSGGVWTCLIGGRFEIHAASGYKSGESTLTSVRLLVDGTIVAEGTTVAASANPVVDATLNIAAGSTLQICSFSAGAYAIDTTVRGKRELYIQMVSK